MSTLRWSAAWPRLVAISLIGFGAAGCSNSDRFADFPGSSSTWQNTTSSVSQNTPSGTIESRPLPHLASADPGISGGGHGIGSYQSDKGDITGSVRSAPPPAWTWEGGTPITVAPGETLETISRQHGVPVSVIMQANNITNPASVHPGEHLVIPRYRTSTAGPTAPATHVASNTFSGAPVGAPRTVLAPTSGTHIVAPGETLHSIARLYGKSVLVLAKANNIPPDTMVRVGEHLVIPDVRTPPKTPAVANNNEVQSSEAAGQDLATAESPHSARVATPVAPSVQDSTVKAAEPAGALPSFRWPVRGRIIANFGPKPNGLQNDGINLAVPEGTPIKAAEDGVVAYAGNELKGYGNLVLLRHANGFVTAYAHASDILVKRGETVKRGQVIAHSGETGNVTSPQLHFEIRKGSTPVDPAQYLNGA